MNYIKTAMLIAVMTALFMAVGFMIGGQSGAMIAFFIAAAMNLFGYWNADKMVLRMNNAQEVDARSAPEFYAMVQKLSQQAGLPMPKVYLINEDQPNAFATGRNPQNAAVAATTGLLQQLNQEEVAAVMAHELAHVQNRDTLIMTITATLAGAISMLGNFAMFFGGNRDSNNGIGVIGTIVAMIFAPLAAMLVQMAISRTREYSADKRGAEILGNPLALASALRKISAGTQRLRNDAAEANPAMAHMYIANPLHGERMDSLFSTHPAAENRIAALEAMARSGGVTRSNFEEPRRQMRPASPSDQRSGGQGGHAGQSGPWGGRDAADQQPSDRSSAGQGQGPWGRKGDGNDPWS